VKYIVEVISSGLFVGNDGTEVTRDRARVFSSVAGIRNSLGKYTPIKKVVFNSYGARKFSTRELDTTTFKVHEIRI